MFFTFFMFFVAFVPDMVNDAPFDGSACTQAERRRVELTPTRRAALVTATCWRELGPPASAGGGPSNGSV